LLEHGANPNARENWKGQTALIWAAAQNNAGAIRALIGAGADMNQTSDEGSFTPFLFAVRGGHIEAAGELLEAGVDVNQSLPDGMSALVLSILNAHYEFAAFLLEHGADPNADAQGWTPLHQVAWSRRPNQGFNLPGAPANGNLSSLDLVRRLVRSGADLNRRMTQEPKDGNRNMLNRIGSTPFLMAAKTDDVPLMRLLLESGADPAIPNEDGTTALMVAAGVGLWAPGESPGTSQEALAAVKLAFESGGGNVDDIDDNGETAMHGAVYRGGALPVIQYLADQGSPLDVVNAKGWTPLVAAEGVEYTPAVLKRYLEAAELLRNLMRERGIDVPEPGQALSVALTNLSAADDAPDRDDAAAPDRTNWDGVYTEAQADRGMSIYQAACTSCHLDNLQGDADAPALAGPEFAERWIGSTANNMVEVMSNLMPPGAPNSLGRPAYVDLVSYLLRANGNPAGDSELPVDTTGLERIHLAPAN
jgi:ankyrin repeat protein/mono/diheme cytochrome c family protein